MPQRDRILLGGADEHLAEAARVQDRIFDYGVPNDIARKVVPMFECKISRRQKHPAFVFDRFERIDRLWVRLPAGDASRRRSRRSCCKGRE